jgi:hypothetical protein
MPEFGPNCFSFTYKELGLISKEEIIPMVSLGRIIENFDLVQTPEEADALAVLVPFGRSLMANHMAVINSDKRTLRHRRGTNVLPSEGEIYEEVKPYMNEEAILIFLKFKPGTEVSFWK